MRTIVAPRLLGLGGGAFSLGKPLIVEVYRSRAYSPELVARYYLQFWPGGHTCTPEATFSIYEVNAQNLTLREVRTDGATLSDLDKARAMGAQRAGFPSQVRLKAKPKGI